MRTTMQLVLILSFLVWSVSFCQEQTVGLFLNDPASFNGYTLFAPLPFTSTYLIDNDGRLIHSWESPYKPGNSVYLLENSCLLRTAYVKGNNVFKGGGAGGKVQIINWDGSVLWEYTYYNSQHCQHHDVEILPNKNILMIAWEYKLKIEAILAGRNPELLKDNALWPDHIIEVISYGPSAGQIVWEWHVWDHLIQDFDSTRANYGIVADHPELIDLNFVLGQGSADWNHTNAIDYNPDLDQIILSVREFSEIWVIDHSTTTIQAAGHSGGRYGKGGDLLFRWGNPQTYRAGTPMERQLFHQHDAHRIESGLPGEGHILIFNNGWGRPQGNYSSIDEIVPPLLPDGQYGLTPGSAYEPAQPIWTYTSDPPQDFYSSYISGTQRLPNGNTLICSGANGTFFEVTSDNEVVWKYVNPVAGNGPLVQGEPIHQTPNGPENSVFRCYRYSPDYSGFTGRDLTQGDPIEQNPTCIESIYDLKTTRFILHQNYPNPFNPSTEICYNLCFDSNVKISVMNILGQNIKTLVDQFQRSGEHRVLWKGKDESDQRVSAGIYLYHIQTGSFLETKKMLLVE